MSLLTDILKGKKRLEILSPFADEGRLSSVLQPELVQGFRSDLKDAVAIDTTELDLDDLKLAPPLGREYARLPFATAWLEDRYISDDGTPHARGIYVREEIRKKRKRGVPRRFNKVLWITIAKGAEGYDFVQLLPIVGTFIDDMGRNYIKKGERMFAAAQGFWRAVERLPDDQRKYFRDELRAGINGTLYTLSLMNTKNIEARPETGKLRGLRKVLRRGVTWHKLHLKLPGRFSLGGIEPWIEFGELTRSHLVRGHFKTYTEDAPLFGQFIGRFWWPPHVRGDETKGVVLKDYVLEPQPSG